MPNVLDPPRYLVSFHPKRVTHRFTDILVIGSGLAGLRAALAADSSNSVVIVTKDQAHQSNSRYAQGGIAAVWNPTDRFDAHAEDTVIAGQGLCDRHIVDLVVQLAPQRVAELIEWGAVFDRVGDHIALTREGGHSANRILHAHGDATGQELVRAVLEQTRSQPNVQIFEDTFTIDLLTANNCCVGALTWSESAGIQAIWAKQTVLATGGCGQLFRETTNPAVATGDGLALAFRAGALVQDMEFMQFHPTVLYVAGSARSLISEAVRGEGAYLRDCQGRRFMPDFDPRAELAPRDIVAKAIVVQMAATQHSCVYLDQSHLAPDKVRQRFPGIAAACEKCGLDFARDAIPVRPGAHYMVGGISTDNQGRTSLPGLWACGETAGTGLHGANRLASNSLLEALVFGHLCGQGAAKLAQSSAEVYLAQAVEHRIDNHTHEELDLGDIRNSLQSLMFRSVGIERDAAGLHAAQKSIQFWSRYVLSREFATPEGWELQNMLTVAALIVAGALERTESRGTHNRNDYPTSEERWCHHLAIHRGLSSPQRLKASANDLPVLL